MGAGKTAASVPRAPAVTKAIAILRLLASEGREMGVNAIARELNIVPSTCLHVLRALEAEALVSIDPSNRKYRAGLGLVVLARDALNRNHLAKAAQPLLEEIAERFGISAVATQLDSRGRMIAVAIGRSPGQFSIHVELGSRFPAFISALGRSLAAEPGLTEQELRERFSSLRWADPPKLRDWLKQIESARREGVGVDPGNYVRGITTIAGSVLSGHRVVGSIAVLMASGQHSLGTIEKIKTMVRTIAVKVSAAVQHHL
jgi:DNA-binding IclR family transcriptional regulator